MPAEPASDHLKPETPHVAAWTVLFSVLGFVVCVAAGMVALYFYYATYLQGPLIPQARDFPEPELQTDPEGDLRRFLAAQRAALTASAAGPNGEPGKIPIERAMGMIVERGSRALDPLLPAATPSPQKTGAAP